MKRLIVTGIAGDICVLFTAHDAHIRGYDLHVPGDCVASNTAERTQRTLLHLREALQVKTGPWQEIPYLGIKTKGVASKLSKLGN